MKIEWNKVTWYSKIIALALFVPLPFIGFYYGTQYGETVAAIGQTSTTTAVATKRLRSRRYYNDPAEWQTDANNTSGGFSIAYPIDFDTQDNYSGDAFDRLAFGCERRSGRKIFHADRSARIRAADELCRCDPYRRCEATIATAVAQCLALDQSGGPATATSSATINGIYFYGIPIRLTRAREIITRPRVIAQYMPANAMRWNTRSIRARLRIIRLHMICNRSTRGR